MIFLIVILGLLAVGVGLFYLKKSKAPVQAPIRLTLKELEKYDGRQGKIYVSIKGQIFDVSSCDAYRPGNDYSIFAGKDGTVALAKMSLSPKDMNIKTKLTPEEQKTLDEWFEYYRDKKKYPIVGSIIDY
jgi:membrane-associated progesterone receptor component